jgi:hypothetical protein
MSTLLDRSARLPAPAAGPGDAAPSSVVVAGLLAAAQAVAASLVVVLVPTVLAWATASYSRAPWEQAVRFGVDAWLLAHHTGIAVPGGHVGLAPLGLLAVPLVACWFAGIRLARAVDPHADAIRDGVGRARPAWPPQRALVALIGGYAGLVTLLAVLITGPGARPLVVQAFAGSALICAPAAACGAGAWVAGGVRPGAVHALRLLRLPVEVTRCLLPAGVAVGVHLAGALLLLLTSFVTGWSQILRLHQALEPGLAGGAVLLVAELTAVPTLVVWAGSFTAGPGFAAGTGTSVTPHGADLGALPAVPLLGALPGPGPQPAAMWLVVALPVAAGAVAGWWILRRRPEAPWRPVLADAGLTALLAGAGWAVLGWLSSGPAGPGRLATFGPVGWLVGGAVLVEVAVGGLLTIGLGLVVRSITVGGLVAGRARGRSAD